MEDDAVVRCAILTGHESGGAFSAGPNLTGLARWVDKGHAMRLTLGIPLTAEEAYRIGLAQWPVPHAKLIVRGR